MSPRCASAPTTRHWPRRWPRRLWHSACTRRRCSISPGGRSICCPADLAGKVQPAVDVDRLTGDVAAVRAEQKCDRVGDLLGPTGAARGDLLLHALDELLGNDAAQTLVPDEPWHDDVH